MAGPVLQPLFQGAVIEQNRSETWIGCLMDIACGRKAPSDELLHRASKHQTDCALMGHCIESGFAIVGGDGRLHLLESAATTSVVRELRRTSVSEGLRFEVVRERDGHEMRTVELRAVAAEIQR